MTARADSRLEYIVLKMMNSFLFFQIEPLPMAIFENLYEIITSEHN
jgi:hypothetical protein